MHFSATTITLLAALLASPAAAMHDSRACSGFGACNIASECNYSSGLGEPTEPEWDCGSAGTVTGQVSAGAQMQFWQGLDKGTVVPRAEFPRCDLAQPSATATLLKTTYEGVTVFGWIDYTCTETTPIKNGCYSTIKNRSTAYTCKLFKAGQACRNLVGKIIRDSTCPK
ncbi:hypothetical protein MN608_09191 [Microdochium nivale]|nr:hypothetical protein MN608_09191 [Microdochium nivale]